MIGQRRLLVGKRKILEGQGSYENPFIKSQDRNDDSDNVGDTEWR